MFDSFMWWVGVSAAMAVPVFPTAAIAGDAIAPRCGEPGFATSLSQAISNDRIGMGHALGLVSSQLVSPMGYRLTDRRCNETRASFTLVEGYQKSQFTASQRYEIRVDANRKGTNAFEVMGLSMSLPLFRPSVSNLPDAAPFRKFTGADAEKQSMVLKTEALSRDLYTLLEQDVAGRLAGNRHAIEYTETRVNEETLSLELIEHYRLEPLNRRNAELVLRMKGEKSSDGLTVYLVQLSIATITASPQN